jgi:hypothetical protein
MRMEAIPGATLCGHGLEKGVVMAGQITLTEQAAGDLVNRIGQQGSTA